MRTCVSCLLKAETLNDQFIPVTIRYSSTQTGGASWKSHELSRPHKEHRQHQQGQPLVKSIKPTFSNPSVESGRPNENLFDTV